MTAIKDVTGRRVWDSRGQPTVEVDVLLENGVVGRAIAPAGASRGTREAIDLRDGGPALRGKGVRLALDNVNGPISAALIGHEVGDQAGADRTLIALDGSAFKDKLGGNATVATSLAILHAASADAGRPLWQHVAETSGCTPSLPLPEIQIFGGGAHAGRRVDIQDFMIMVPGATSFDEVMEVTSEVYFAAGDIMATKGNLAGVADEGGWWPVFGSNEEALETLVQAIEKTGETPGDRVVISLDIAASELGKNGRYRLALEDRELDSGAMIDMLGGWLESYPIASIEDPLSEDDVEGTIEFTRRYGDRVQIIGDDYLVTNADLVREAQAQGACNAVLIKVNQAGTVSESIETFRAARTKGWRAIVSARSGETEDVSISHLATGLGAGTESRLVHPLGAHGQMERVLAHSGRTRRRFLRGWQPIGEHMVGKTIPELSLRNSQTTTINWPASKICPCRVPNWKNQFNQEHHARPTRAGEPHHRKRLTHWSPARVIATQCKSGQDWTSYHSPALAGLVRQARPNFLHPATESVVTDTVSTLASMSANPDTRAGRKGT